MQTTKRFIHIIVGSTGEYDEWGQWNVCGFQNRRKARRYLKKCEKEAKRIRDKRVDKYRLIKPGENKYDPCMMMDYTGTDYRIDTIEFIDADTE